MKTTRKSEEEKEMVLTSSEEAMNNWLLLEGFLERLLDLYY